MAMADHIPHCHLWTSSLPIGDRLTPPSKIPVANARATSSVP
ncbi:hypothetical protein [Kibdelosporangium philippinense]